MVNLVHFQEQTMLFRWVEALSFYKEKIKVKLQQEMLKKELVQWLLKTFFLPVPAKVRRSASCREEETWGWPVIRWPWLRYHLTASFTVLHITTHNHHLMVHWMEMLWIGRSGSGSYFLFWCQSRSGSRSYPKTQPIKKFIEYIIGLKGTVSRDFLLLFFFLNQFLPSLWL